MAFSKEQQRQRRKNRLRKKISGSASRPRLTVYRSLRYIYAQLVDDLSGRTLVSADSLKAKEGSGNKQAGELVCAMLAEKAKSVDIKQVTFDRNGFIYHGVVKALAEAARKGGLEF